MKEVLIMKKLYEQPKTVFNTLDVEDVLTNSANTFYSNSTTVHSDDVYDFSSFIA